MKTRYQQALRAAARTTLATIEHRFVPRTRWHARGNRTALCAAFSGAEMYARGFSSVGRG